jgi:hypothetical protein
VAVVLKTKTRHGVGVRTMFAGAQKPWEPNIKKGAAMTISRKMNQLSNYQRREVAIKEWMARERGGKVELATNAELAAGLFDFADARMIEIAEQERRKQAAEQRTVNQPRNAPVATNKKTSATTKEPVEESANKIELATNAELAAGLFAFADAVMIENAELERRGKLVRFSELGRNKETRAAETKKKRKQN